MRSVVLGDGPMGLALADALAGAGHTAETLGAPAGNGHPRDRLATADVVYDFSTGPAVAANAQAALEAGCRRLVIGTTGWHATRPAVERLLARSGTAAVAASNFSIGLATFGRLVDQAAGLLEPFGEYDPFILEWHRAAKLDRPSGTAKELARTLVGAGRRKRRVRDAPGGGPAAEDELEVASLRAGSSPGMHLVGFDAPGETIELRLTARDRSAYSAGAIRAGEWLLRARRSPGLHDFTEVLSEEIQS